MCINYSVVFKLYNYGKCCIIFRDLFFFMEVKGMYQGQFINGGLELEGVFWRLVIYNCLNQDLGFIIGKLFSFLEFGFFCYGNDRNRRSCVGLWLILNEIY